MIFISFRNNSLSHEIISMSRIYFVNIQPYQLEVSSFLLQETRMITHQCRWLVF